MQNQKQNRLKTIAAKLAQINQESASLTSGRITPLEQRRDTLRNDVAIRDWSIEARTTGRKPRGAHSDPGGTDATYQARSGFYAKLCEVERELGSVKDEERRLRKAANELESEAESLRAELLTVADLAPALADAEQAVTTHASKRIALADKILAIQRQLTNVDQAIAAGENAERDLERRRADAFLASNMKAAAQALDVAELAHGAAKEKSAGAQAAVPRIQAEYAKAHKDLEAHDATAAELEAALLRLRTKSAAITARAAIRDALHALGLALRDLHVIVPDEATRLFNAWRDEGLCDLDSSGKGRKLAWLLTNPVAGIFIPDALATLDDPAGQ